MLIFRKNKLFNMRAERCRDFVDDVLTLDVGSGDGSFISSLLDPSKVVAVDGSRERLDRNPSFRKILLRLPGKFPFEDNSFDQVTSFEFFEHLERKEDLEAVLKEIYRVLRPGGKLVFSTPNYDRLSTLLRSVVGKKRSYPVKTAHHYHFIEYSPSELQELLRDAGFGDIYMECWFVHLPLTGLYLNFRSRWGSTIFGFAMKPAKC